MDAIRREMRVLGVVAWSLLSAVGCGAQPEPAVCPPSPHAGPERGLIEQLSKEAKAGGTASAPAGKPGTFDASFYRAYAETRGFRMGRPAMRTPTPDGSAVVFLRAISGRDTRQALYEVSTTTGKERLVLSPDDVAKGPETLTAAEKARRERMRVIATGFTSFALTKDGREALVSLSGKLVLVTRSTGLWTELPVGDAAAIDPHLSPDGSEVAFVANSDLHVVSTRPANANAKAIAVTKGGTEDKPHGVAEFVAQEEMERSRGFWWSPDGQKILFEEADLKPVERWSIVDPGHPEGAPERVAYPRPGKANAEVKLGITPAHGGKTTWIEWDRATFPYVARVTWAKDAPPLIYALDRAQKNGALLAVDPATGKTREVLREHDDVFLNIDSTVPFAMPGGNRALWASEHDGAWRLYIVDLTTGALVPLTTKDFGYRDVLGVDESGTTVIVQAGAESTEQHVYALHLDRKLPVGVEATRIDAGAWSNASVGEQTKVVSIGEQKIDAPVAYVVRDAGGKEIARIENQAETPSITPTTHIETVGADRTRVAVTVPQDFVKGRKYPVIDAAYGGPHAQVAYAAREAFLFDQAMADGAGAIVVAIDSKGTPNRDRAWERAVKDHFADVPLDGHVTTLRDLFKLHPEMDADRVGVFGWSFGGYYSALALLRRPDVYKVAVAGAPVVDWRDYDTAYTERYLGVPPADGKSAVYDENSLLTYASAAPTADHPARPLLLIHGTADDNVYFVNSLRLTTALERARRPFELYPLVGVTHMPVDPKLAEAMWAHITDFLAQGLQK